MFLAACLATLCIFVPAGAIWMGIESLDRSAIPSELGAE